MRLARRRFSSSLAAKAWFQAAVTAATGEPGNVRLTAYLASLLRMGDAPQAEPAIRQWVDQVLVRAEVLSGPAGDNTAQGSMH